VILSPAIGGAGGFACPFYSASNLESELRPQLTRERSRHDHPSRRNEAIRLPEIRGFDIAHVPIAEVRAIGQVERLEDQFHARALPDLHRLADPQVHLEEGLTAQVVEAHLLDFTDDLYGEELELIFGEKLRDEKKFASLTDLRDQIARDILEAQLRF
jgi:hypothetical protein